MQAAEHSPHGYDVVNPTRVSDALGGDEGLRRLDTALTNAGSASSSTLSQTTFASPSARTPCGGTSCATVAPAHTRDSSTSIGMRRACRNECSSPCSARRATRCSRPEDLTVVAAPDGGFELHYEGSAFPLAQDTAATVGPVSQEILDGQHYILEFFRPGPLGSTIEASSTSLRSPVFVSKMIPSSTGASPERSTWSRMAPSTACASITSMGFVTPRHSPHACAPVHLRPG